MSNGLQTFMRMANLYNPQQMAGTPPVGPMQPQLINRASSGQHMPFPFGGPVDEEVTVGFEPRVDEEVTVGTQEPQSTLEAFRQNVLNPPQRTHMTYPKDTLAGLEAGLKVAATPTDYEKNRVYVNGDAYQQVRAFKDPVTGEQKFINKYKQPGFMEQVLKAMPAAVSPVPGLLNQPYEDALADWELRNKSLTAATNAEANMALAQQRYANAGAIPTRLDQGQQRIDISRLTAEERVRLSQLNTLTDEQKLQMLQSGRMSLAEYNAAEALKRVEAQQTGANTRNAATIAGANQRNQATIAGANQRTQAMIAAANERNRATLAARGTTGSQDKLRMQKNAVEFINRNPELGEFISFDSQGFPTISPDTPDDVAESIFSFIYSIPKPDVYLPPQTPGSPQGGGMPSPTPAPTPAPAPNTPQQAAPINIPPPKIPGVQPILQQSPSTGRYRISYDGGKTWIPFNPNGTGGR